jgi:UDP-N-acetylmuramyl tripeptide synthase
MTGLEAPEFMAVPHALTSTRYLHRLSDRGVTHLVVENWSDPATGRRLEKLSRDSNASSPDVA